MSRYEKLLHMLMDYDSTIMFTAIGDTSGNILWNTIRDDSKVQVPLPEIKKTLVRESNDWISRCKIEDSDELGRAMYHIASFEKIKQITIPLDAFHLLMVYVDNALHSKKQKQKVMVVMSKWVKLCPLLILLILLKNNSNFKNYLALESLISNIILSKMLMNS